MLGIFDSGLGGLTVVKEIIKVLPEYGFLYLGDTARTPYGNKSKEVVAKYGLADTQFLINKGAELIIVACNTVSANAIDAVKQKVNLPIFEVITPAVEAALKASKNGRIGVIGTRATISSAIYEKKLKELGGGKIAVVAQACPLLVPLVEEGWLQEGETKRIVKKYLQGLKTHNIDTLILGCTHYPLLKDIIQRAVGRRVTVIDSAENVALAVKDFLDQNHDIKKTLLNKVSDNKFFVTDLTPHFQVEAEKFLGQKIKLEKVEI